MEAAAAAAFADDVGALEGYDVLIADRGNNRIILVSPDRRGISAR